MDFEQYMSTRNFGLIINFLSLNLLNSNLDKQGTMKMSLRDGFKKRKKKLMEFSIKGPDPASQLFLDVLSKLLCVVYAFT